ncbi:MAG: PucR family transcriptional regulator [Gordonia sp. (in: high G+C Gram-positive bacteria)]|uniref:PucR family transcriptional regulator n=1 Tax=Gordonia sp. (in: high G+C Gram-positive bacteria) TaxID=84139 RepID=UPI0039E3CF3A
MTVRRLAARRGLGLSIVAGAAGAERTVRWAHAIELRDPVPWLSGGELVMTTGLAWPDDPDGLRDYVHRLDDAGVAALAVDTGTTFTAIPEPVLAAAEERGLALLRVPAETPFIAVSRAVIDDLNADLLRAVQRVVDDQERLARAAARGGIALLAETLSSRIGAGVCVVDRAGEVIAQAGAVAGVRARIVARLASEGDRIGGSRVMVDDEATLTLNPLPPTGDPHGYLAVSSPRAVDAAARVLVGHAVSLLSSEMAKPLGVLDAESRLRSACLALLRSGGALDPQLARRLGFRDGDPVSVLFVLPGATPPEAAAQAAAQALDRAGASHLIEALDDGVALVVASSAASHVGELLVAALARPTAEPVRIGIARDGALASVPAGVGQARAAAAAVRDGTGVRRIDEVSTLALLLDQRPEARAALITGSRLEVLVEHDGREGTDLVATLDAYLRSGGRIDDAAAALGVHRHTLRHRIRKVIAVTGRDIDDPAHRAELWLALQARLLGPTPATEAARNGR